MLIERLNPKEEFEKELENIFKSLRAGGANGHLDELVQMARELHRYSSLKVSVELTIITSVRSFKYVVELDKSEK